MMIYSFTVLTYEVMINIWKYKEDINSSKSFIEYYKSNFSVILHDNDSSFTFTILVSVVCTLYIDVDVNRLILFKTCYIYDKICYAPNISMYRNRTMLFCANLFAQMEIYCTCTIVHNVLVCGNVTCENRFCAPVHYPH